MSYIVLARKYRPATFADVIGQSEITNKLKAALSSGRTAHAYLFCGPRGVGKTTCARILAKELNKNISSQEDSFNLGMPADFDIIEIDGASNNSVDDIRTLRENAQLVPMGGGVKVYIIDEVHMLSTAAFNALLKTLEEPPAHVKFVFATTDPNKLPLTVVSRCQRFDFRRIPLEQMAGYLKEVCVKERFEADEDALYAIAKAAQGSMRDALSVLDQLSSSSAGKIEILEVNAMLGLVEVDHLFALAEALLRKDCSSALKVLNDVLDKGKDVKPLSQDMIGFFRNLMVMKAGGQELQDLIDYSVSYKKMLYEFVALVSMAEIIFIIDRLVESQDTARIIEMPALALEIALAKIVSRGTAAVPVVRPAVSAQPVVAKPSPANPPVKPTYIPGNILNNKGSVVIAADPVLDKPSVMLDGKPSAIVTFEEIQKNWHALTHAVCQISMSVGTFLQGGRPLKFDGRKLTIGFSHENEFHKEFLEHIVNIKMIAEAVQAVFKFEAAIELVVTDDLTSMGQAPLVNDALAMFGGEVVNEWDSDDGISKSN